MPALPLRTRSRRSERGNKLSVATISEEGSPLESGLDEKEQAARTNALSAQSSRQRKKVTWNHRVEKKRHHRLQDLSNEEIESVWYTESDSKIILASAKVTVKMMMKGEPCDDFDYCSRGLEGKTPEGSKRRQKNKLRVRKKLLNEQDLQREEGVFDPEYLAHVCTKYSRENVVEAYNQGLRDEQDIQEYLYMNDGDCLPTRPLRQVSLSSKPKGGL